MKIRLECQTCSALNDSKVCTNCYEDVMVTVYCCELCGKAWYWKSSEKECCVKKKEEKFKKNK